MKFYNEKKFKELSLERQVRILLETIYELERVWGGPQQIDQLDLFRNYFLWLDPYSCESPLLKRMGSFQFKMDQSLSLRQFLDLAVPLERYLNLSIKDEHIFQVSRGDRAIGERKTVPLCFVLDHLRSAFNVGSLFRTAECLGVERIYLVGYTPNPEDKRVQKTAMGAEKMVPWSSHHHIDEVLEELGNKSYQMVALETATHSTPLHKFVAPASLAFLVGNERFGLMESLLERVDRCVEIPMMGSKNSLNVANSLSIASFEVVRQWMS